MIAQPNCIFLNRNLSFWVSQEECHLKRGRPGFDGRVVFKVNFLLAVKEGFPPGSKKTFSPPELRVVSSFPI